MINIDALGLDEAQREALEDALKKDSVYRLCLLDAGLPPRAAERILQATDTSTIDPEQAEALTEKARIEWGIMREPKKTA